MAARQVFPRDAESSIVGRAGGVEQRVEVLGELRVLEVTADLDVAVQPEPAARFRESAVMIDHRAALGVIRRDAVACQPAGDRQSLEQVHGGGRVAGQQVGRGVEAGGPGADDRDAERGGCRRGRAHRRLARAYC